ncbi:hypothetical protein C8R46DRAFT_1055025 [Mycena filopes]|nr:hypothetical protein C8R46DRAFT_1055025 [Mycena filopes]
MDAPRSTTSYEISAYMRIASLAIAFYDLSFTLFFLIRYVRQSFIAGASHAILLDRYTSIVVLIVSNAGFFALNFDKATCERYYLPSYTDFTTSAICIWFLLRLKTSSGSIASLGYCVIWIMSQRLLIHLHEVSVERRNESLGAAITVTQHFASARDVSRAVRSQFESKNGGFDLTDDDVDVEVRIERTVRVERVERVRGFELENYSRTARSYRTQN